MEASDLQSDIEFNGNEIVGSLNYISEGWDPGTWGSDEDTGYYIALHFEVPDVEGVTIQVTFNRTTTLDEDGIVVCHVVDKNSQILTVVASKEGYPSVTKIYGLSGLTLESA